MTIIVVEVPKIWSRELVAQFLKPKIWRNFEVLDYTNIHENRKKHPPSTSSMIYVKLSEQVNVPSVLLSISKHPLINFGFLHVFVPQETPDITEPLNGSIICRRKTSREIFIEVHYALLVELQTVCTNLYSISKEYDHKLLDRIAVNILDRLQNVVANSPKCIVFHWNLCLNYRKYHPWTTDPEFLYDTLQQLECDLGFPSSNPNRFDFTSLGRQVTGVHLKDLYYTTEHLCPKVIETMKNYAGQSNHYDTEQEPDKEIARKKVRETLNMLMNSNYVRQMTEAVARQSIIEAYKSHASLDKVIYIYPQVPDQKQLKEIFGDTCSIVVRDPHHHALLHVQAHDQKYFPHSKLKFPPSNLQKPKRIVVRDLPLVLYEVPQELRKQMELLFDDDDDDDVMGDEEIL